jgi:membrane associated rhomboid family serine protease
MTDFFYQSPASILILVITVLISLYGLYGDHSLLEAFLLKPNQIKKNKNFFAIITHGFIHADLSHLLFNMMTFYFFALYLEKSIGTLNFLILYFSSMVLSSIPTIIKHWNDPDYACLGASGAINAVMFSFILLNPFDKIYIYFIPFGIPALIYGPCYLAYCIYASNKKFDNINHSAHFYGALSGIFLIVLFDHDVTSHFIELFKNAFSRFS